MVQQGRIRFIHLAVLVKKKVVTHMAVTMVDLADIVVLGAMVTAEGAVDTVEGVVDIAEEVVMTIVEVGTVGEVVMDTVVVVIVVEVEVTVAEEVMDTVPLVVTTVGEDTDTVAVVIVVVVTVEVEAEGMGTVEEEITENVMTATTMEAMILDTNLPGNLGLMDTRHQTSNVNTKRKLFMSLKLNINLRRNALRYSLRVVKRNMRQEKA